MAKELLIRAYNVSLGDCIYVRIPDRAGDFHMLVDCGTLGDRDLLRQAFEDLKIELPKSKSAPGKRQLDLLVITHRHKDHILGIGMDIFKDIDIKHIWLSAAMDKDHPQAKGLQSFQAGVQQALAAMDTRALSPALAEVVAAAKYPYKKETEALEGGMGATPVFVHASTRQPDKIFGLQDTRIHVLGPEKDIDGLYLGDLEAGGHAFGPSALVGMNKFINKAPKKASGKANSIPKTISLGDFQQLRNRMMYNGLAFAYADNSFANNSSVVLLIEWRGKRLLFTGDAEWHGAFKKGNHNGSWNVMWKKRKKLLDGTLDFLKVGHHGSENATPWNDSNPNHKVNDILDSILPKKGRRKETAQAIVSTRRANYASIPGVHLVPELGERVANTRVYSKKLSEDQLAALQAENPALFEIEQQTLALPQPWRTDFEAVITGKQYVDVKVAPKTGT